MLLRHAVSYSLSKIVPGLINVLALALYTRWLDSAAFGRYALVLAVVALGQLVVFRWLLLGTLRFYQRAQDDGHLPILLSTVAGSFAFSGILMSAAWILVLVLVPLDAELKSALYLGLPCLGADVEPQVGKDKLRCWPVRKRFLLERRRRDLIKRLVLRGFPFREHVIDQHIELAVLILGNAQDQSHIDGSLATIVNHTE